MVITDIQYKNAITGYFPLLQKKVNNGFSWGKDASNMLYTGNEPPEVKTAIDTFYKENKFSTQDIMMFGQHKDDIFDVNEQSVTSIMQTTYGRRVNVDAIFCTLPGYTLFTNPADCTISVIYAITKDKKPVIGLLHAGRKGADILLPLKAIQHLHDVYDVAAEDIFIGIAPSIAKSRYRMENVDSLLHKTMWEEFYEKKEDGYYLDVLGFVLKQYKDAGILDEHIEAYIVDTYDAASRKESFSYYYSHEIDHIILTSRFRVAVCL